MRISIRSAMSGTDRAAGWDLRSPAKPRGVALEVTLVAWPTSLDPPPVHEIVRVRSAAEMHAAVLDRARQIDVVVMAAAVADYAPAERLSQKVSKDAETLTVVLKRTPDILGDLGRLRRTTGNGPVLVGFAAETQHVLTSASAKREAKQVDLIVANDVSKPVSDSTPIRTGGRPSSVRTVPKRLPLQSKSRVASAILDRVEKLLTSQATRSR